MNDTYAPAPLSKKKKHPVSAGDVINMPDGSHRNVIKIQKRYPGFVVIYFTQESPMTTVNTEIRQFCKEAGIDYV